MSAAPRQFPHARLEVRDEADGQMKLTEYGAAVTDSGILSKEDQKAVELAERAQRGDYDDGELGSH